MDGRKRYRKGKGKEKVINRYVVGSSFAKLELDLGTVGKALGAKKRLLIAFSTPAFIQVLQFNCRHSDYVSIMFITKVKENIQNLNNHKVGRPGITGNFFLTLPPQLYNTLSFLEEKLKKNVPSILSLPGFIG